MLRPVSAIRVSLWGHVVGVIAGQSAGYYRFEFEPDFLSSGIEISPLKMKARPGVIVCNDLPLANFRGLPPVFADSLPDSFGNELVNEWMRCQGVAADSISALDRLAYVGDRGMGALTYEPVRGPGRTRSTVLNMRRIVQDAQLALNGRLSEMSGGAALKEIFRVGTSAGGAQSKAVVGWNRDEDRFCVGSGELPDGYEHWIVKISPEDRPYYGAAEYRTYQKAVECGIDISESRLFELDGVRHFMTRRFDREGAKRHHVQTLRAIRHLADDRMGVDSLSYDQLFMTIEELNMPYAVKEEMFRRMAFNVYADESDDHSKNFSFILKEGDRWMLAPAYDLTGGVPSEAATDDARRQWTNCHALSINGKQSNITDDDLFAVADRFAVGTAEKVLTTIKNVFGKKMRHAMQIMCFAGILMLSCLGMAAQVLVTDELMVDWIAQDAGIGPGVNPLGGDVEATCTRALAKVGMAKGPNEPWEAALARYREFCLKRRAQRLAPVVATSPRWVYARHFVMGGSHYAYTEALSCSVYERAWDNCGGGLYMAELDATGFWRETPLLETKSGCFRDVDVSLDGKRVLYSYKADGLKDDYHLYELDLATRQVRQLTNTPGIADFEGCYLPDGRILFASSRCRQIVDCFFTEVSNLFRMDADGSNVFRVTFDQVHDTFPTLCEDGTVLYTRWEYNDRSQMFPQPLFRMAADGTGQRAHYGANSWYPTTLIHARMVGKGPLVFAIGTGHHTFQPGELLLVDVREGREEGAGVYEVEPRRPAQRVKEDAFRIHGRIAAYPYPVDERSAVLAFLPEGWPRHNGHPNYHSRRAELGLYWTNVDGERELLVGRRGRVPCGRPIPVKARNVFPRPSSMPDEKLATGTVYIRDVYEGAAMAGVPRGTVKSVRVVEIDYRHVGIGYTENLGPGGLGLSSTPPAVGDASWDVKKVWGEVPVNERGAVAFEAPARVPFYFQLLDAKGRAVQTMRSWTVLQPGETASCVGCHEPLNLAPAAVGEAQEKVQKGVMKRPERGISFLKDIQPILDRRCASCHNPGRNPTLPDFTARQVVDVQAKRAWTQSYLSLTHARFLRLWNGTSGWKGDSNHIDLNWVHSGSEPTLLPPYSRGAAASRIFTQRIDRGHCPALTDAEQRLLACWVDLCVPFCGDYQERAVWNADEKKAWDVAEKRFRDQSRTYR